MNKEINAMEDKYKLYDELLATLYVNIQVEYGRDEGIYIYGYTDTPECNVYMRMAEAHADLNDIQIVMLMPLMPYLRFKFKRWKVRKRYKWIAPQKYYETVTPLTEITRFVAEHFKQPYSIYEDIYNEYYK